MDLVHGFRGLTPLCWEGAKVGKMSLPHGKFYVYTHRLCVASLFIPSKILDYWTVLPTFRVILLSLDNHFLEVSSHAHLEMCFTNFSLTKLTRLTTTGIFDCESSFLIAEPSL